MLYGLLDLSLKGYAIAIVILTQITIATVTIFLHRCQSHKAVKLHVGIDTILAEYKRDKKDENKSDFDFYYHNVACYWVKAFNFMPTYTVNNVQGKSSGIVRLHAKNKDYRNLCIAILNSNLFYWYWNIYGDGFHVTLNDIKRFPIFEDKINEEKLESLVYELMKSYKNNAELIKMKIGEKIIEVESFNAKCSRNIIDKIDRFLGSFFNLAEEELQFIIDFDKEYRIGEDENNELVEVLQKFENSGIRTQYWAYRPKSYYTCYSDKFYHRVINFDGNIYKCTARNYNDENQVGVLKDNGEIELNNQKISNLFSNSTFENDRCLTCKFLPLCFGPCIQKNYEVRFKNANFKCLFDDAELSVNNFIISEAKKRQLVKQF